MKSLRLSFFVLCVAFFCVANSNPLLGFLGKRSDDKAEAGELDEQATVNLPSTAKSANETTPSTSCEGLKNFLHICDKNEPTESPKNIKTRSVPEKDSDEDSDENKSDDDDSDDSDESVDEKEKKRKSTETSQVMSEPTEGEIAKRQVGDSEAPVLGEVPPVVSDPTEFPEEPIENPEEDKAKEKRQVEDTNSNSSSDEDKTEEILEGSRRRRDCKDRDAYYGKNCRRKREFVPSCFEQGCKTVKTTEESKKLT